MVAKYTILLSFFFTFLFITHLYFRSCPPPKNYPELAQEADRVFLTTSNSLSLPSFPTRTPSSPEEVTDTTAAMTACRQSTDGLCSDHTGFGTKAKQCRKPCSFIELSNRWQSLSATGVGLGCKLLFITGSIYSRRLLRDCGAQRSILPTQPVDTMVGRHCSRMDPDNLMTIRRVL